MKPAADPEDDTSGSMDTDGDEAPGRADSVKSGVSGGAGAGQDVPASGQGTPGGSLGTGTSGSGGGSAGGSGVGSEDKPERKEQKAPGSSAESADARRIFSLLDYYRDLSDNCVREFTAGWDHAGFAGTLVTGWQSEQSRPLSLLWLHDAQASTARNDDQQLAAHLKDLPPLPYWSFGSDHDGDDLMRALILGDVAGPTQQLPTYKPIWDVNMSLQRDSLRLTVVEQARAQEDEAILNFRQRCDRGTTHMRRNDRWSLCSSTLSLSISLSPSLAPFYVSALQTTT